MPDQTPAEAVQFDESKAQDQLEYALHLLKQAKGKRFYGKVIFTFQGGLIENVETHQKFKPPSRRDLG